MEGLVVNVAEEDGSITCPWESKLAMETRGTTTFPILTVWLLAGLGAGLGRGLPGLSRATPTLWCLLRVVVLTSLEEVEGRVVCG